MIIDLYIMNDEKNKLDKTLYDRLRMTGTLRQETSIVNPTINMEIDNPSAYNYMYIPEFRRYYYITDMESLRNDMWRISGHCDVLMTYGDGIAQSSVILADTQTEGYEQYMAGTQWRELVKTTTDIITFTNGLNDTGEYILITSGGVVNGN